MLEYRPTWSTPQGGVGYTVFHQAGDLYAPADYTAIHAFFDSIKTYIASGVTVSFPSDVLIKDAATGQLTGAFTVTPPASVTGTGSGAYPAPAGARIDWATGGVFNGRRVKGRTFIVPLYGGGYDTNGTLGSSVVTGLATAANTLVAAMSSPGAELSVWSRRAGLTYPVTGATVRDKASVLRGRNA